MPAEKPDRTVALDLFLKLGLDERTAQNAVANAKVTTNLLGVIREANVENGCTRACGNLLYTVATKFPNNALTHRPFLISNVTSEKIKNNTQLEAAFQYFNSIGSDSFDSSEFALKCGIGIEVSTEEISMAVGNVIRSNMDLLIAQRYRTNVGVLLSQVRELQPWADGKVVKEIMDIQLKDVLGERTPEDDGKPTKKKKEKKAKPEDINGAIDVIQNATVTILEETDPYTIFPKPQDNNIVHTEIFFSDGSIWRPSNSRERLEKHLRETGGKFVTRFPPEPNGYLHIGHAKAMFIDFGLAKEYGGNCYLRYDDTNPDAEKKEYIDHIQEIVHWVGWEPYKITYSSDYFQELYDLAVELIKRGYAYVDHQTPDEIKEYREKKWDSPWRNRPIAESLKLFDDMKRGMLDEGTATLRMKQDMKNENFNMLDLIAYRIKFTRHPHAGDKWCIYPSYDYTHCIVDSLENVTHSLCTLEFESRRASYYWLLEALGLYLPYVWEYSRLSMTHTVLSKRKLNHIVTGGFVNGWDDPRLMTLSGLRRRGATPESINAFCRGIGITRSDNLIRAELLEHYIRDDLNRNSPRTMVVLLPLKVVIDNFEEGKVETVEGRKWPDGDPSATYQIPFTRVVYIEKSDFRLKDSKDYYGLAPGKTVLLRYAYPIKCCDIVTNDHNEVIEIHAIYDPNKSTKPKGVLHWVAEPSPGIDPLRIEARLFDKLFNSENPGELDDWLSDLNPRSLEIIRGAFATPNLAHAKLGDAFQFERTGYFCVDKDSVPENLVFNRTVTLKSSYPRDFKL